MNCPVCKSPDIMFDEKVAPIVYSCNGCGHQWHNREMYFESFLEEQHGKQCNLPGDMWPDDYEKWLQDLSIDEWIDFGERFGNKRARSISDLLKACKDAVKYVYSVEKGESSLFLQLNNAIAKAEGK